MRLFAVLLLALGCRAAQIEDLEWRGRLSRGSSLEIRGINGDIFAFPSTSGEVEVTARIDREETSSTTLEVRLEPTGNGIALCAALPGQENCYKPGEKPATGPGTRVDFFVAVPEGVDFAGRTVNGAVEVQSLRSDVEAYTVNGQVRISTTGSAQARTVNGSINVSLSNPFWRKAPAFSTVNGGITLNLPSDLDASLKAHTRNGKVSTDFRFLKGRVTEQCIEARIGKGSANALTLETVNGSIQLKQTL